MISTRAMQDIAAQAAVRLKVARAIYAHEMPGTWEEATDTLREVFYLQADAAISATLRALIEMELPENMAALSKGVLNPAGEDLGNTLIKRQPLQLIFRAILVHLQPLLTKEARQ